MGRVMTYRIVAASVVAAALFLLSSAAPWPSTAAGSLPGPDVRALFDGARVAVIEQTTYHEEVIGSVATVLQDLGVNYTFYRHGFLWGFTDVLDGVDIPTPLPPRSIAEPLAADEYDVVVLVTCDAKFWGGWDAVIAGLHSSSTSVVCIFHEVEWLGRGERDHDILAPLAREGRLHLLTLGAHSARRARTALRHWARDRLESFWEGVQVERWAPVFRLPADVLGHHRDKGMRKAGVLGRIIQGSRDYIGLFDQLATSLQAHPQDWGYSLVPAVDDTPARLVPEDEPFELHLIGKYDPRMWVLELPPILNDTDHPVVRVESQLSYTEFYNTVGDMDVILPAFRGYTYLESRSSAAMPAAIMTRTPILAHSLILDAYDYLAPPAYHAVPLGVTDVDALRAIRTGRADELAVPGAPAADLPGTQAEQWAGCQAELRELNLDVWGGAMGWACETRRARRLGWPTPGLVVEQAQV